MNSENFNDDISSISINDMKISKTNSNNNISRMKSNSKMNRYYLPTINSNNSVLTQIYKNKKTHGPLYIFIDSQKKVPKQKSNRNRKPKQPYLKMYDQDNSQSNLRERQDYNVFNVQDQIIKDLMLQFKAEQNKKRGTKLQRRKMALNKLYDITPEFKKQYARVKRIKNVELGEYQENILTTIPAKSMEQGDIMDLVQKFKNLKKECDSVKPLPPIRVKMIEDHVHNKKSSVDLKKLNLKEYLEQANKPKDEFEKEQSEIKKMRSYKKIPKDRRNKNYDFLPLFLRESLKQNLKFHL